MAKKSLKESCDGLMQDLANETGASIMCGDGSTIEPQSDGVEAKPNGKAPADVIAKVISDTNEEIRRFMPRLKESEREHRDLADQAKEAKKAMEANHAHLSMLGQRLADAMNGNYQPTLFDAEQKPLPLADEGAAMPVGVLKDHGLTDKMVEILVDHEFPTIGKLESAMKADEWWHRKIKGFGEERVTKLIDAYTAFRVVHPIPTPEDAEEVGAAT